MLCVSHHCTVLSTLSLKWFLKKHCSIWKLFLFTVEWSSVCGHSVSPFLSCWGLERFHLYGDDKQCVDFHRDVFQFSLGWLCSGCGLPSLKSIWKLDWWFKDVGRWDFKERFVLMDLCISFFFFFLAIPINVKFYLVGLIYIFLIMIDSLCRYVC